jgi:hypothetical protein
MARSPTQPGARWARTGRARFALVAVLCALPLAGCEKPVDDGEPEGALLVARRDALASLLSRLEALDGTPLSRAAAGFAADLPDCAVLEAWAATGRVADLLPALTCRTQPSPLEALHRARGERDLVFVLPVGDGPPLRGSARLDGGDVALELRWRDPPEHGALGLLLPGHEVSGPDLLAAGGRLAHARVRPEAGLDVAALVPADSQADRLFRMRADLFAGAVLDGTWEGALYLPRSGGTVPRAALALGFGLRAPAIAAAESFVADLTSTWPVRRVDFAHDGAPGACLLDLKILPELAPCYVATDRALVVGWNAGSLEVALALADASTAEDETAGRMEIDLALFAEADALLARHLDPEARPRVAHWPWRRLLARGRTENGELRVRVSLEKDADT